MATPSKARDLLIAEVREAFGRVVYTHKTQEKEADRKTAHDRWVRLWQLIFSSVTTAGLLAVIVTDKAWLEVASALFATATSFLTAYAKNFRAGEAAKDHQVAAQALWLLREQHLSLLVDLEGDSVSLIDARARRDDLQLRLAEVYKSAPRTSPESYAAAQQALQVKQELTFTEQEVDTFLPQRLRKAGPPTAGQAPPASGAG